MLLTFLVKKCLVVINKSKFVYFNLSRAYHWNVIVYLHGKTNSEFLLTANLKFWGKQFIPFFVSHFEIMNIDVAPATRMSLMFLSLLRDIHRYGKTFLYPKIGVINSNLRITATEHYWDKILFGTSLDHTRYRKVANSGRPLLVAAPLVTFFNLLSKIGPKKY